jgi:hypothetical protein
MAAVLENLPAGFRGAVVINVTPIGLAPDANYLRRITTNPRLGFSSPYIRRAAAEAGIEMRPLTGVYLLDNAPFFAARVACVRNILTGPRAVGRLYDDRPQLPDPGRWRRMNDFFAEYARGIETQGEAAFGTLADIVALCRERGATTIALLESVLNTRATDEWPAESLALYDAMMREFVEAHAVERWDLSAETGATPDDYVDWVHLKPGGARDRYTRALAQRLAGIVAPAEFAP